MSNHALEIASYFRDIIASIDGFAKTAMNVIPDDSHDLELALLNAMRGHNRAMEILGLGRRGRRRKKFTGGPT